MTVSYLAQVCVLLATLVAVAASANFVTDVDITWGDSRAKILDNGQLLELTMDEASGSGFQSKNEYLFGRLDMPIKLVPGNSAGTVTTFYLSSQGPAHDEIDFEFLGNISGEPYVLHTNVVSFHNYSILWNPHQIVFYVDATPIRVFRNSENMGVAYPKNQPMRLYSSLWDGDDWATRGGLVKTDWSQAPFVASYKSFSADACVLTGGTSLCPASKGAWWDQELNASEEQRLKWVRSNYMIYNYCEDAKRFPQGLPPECTLEQ
uniref:Xyloglucan endotransglucosylase/hydrolase n=1 Tax=Ananas comosus var. bracteatus TaxID=296719 RepID=A0A6V7P250_ANACO|nr:unnamed protein product [Ananas comosus var. bracteatus]